MVHRAAEGEQQVRQPIDVAQDGGLDGIDAEALMVGLRDLAAVSNGSACTSQSYTPSHVLTAMSLPPSAVAGAVRLSWCHLTPAVDWAAMAARILTLR